MRRTIYNILFAAALTVASVALSSCEKVDELPPVSDTNNINKYYKLDDPTYMNSEQQAQYSEIKAEYEAATK